MNNKVVVITGAGGVLCSEIAKAFSKEGAKVCLLGRNLDKLLVVENEIKNMGYIASSYACDVIDKLSLENVYEKIKKDFGSCDILINGAGGNNSKGQTSNEFFNKDDLNNSNVITFYDMDPIGFDEVFKLNLTGAMLASQVFSKDMAQCGRGNILNISSMNSYRPLTKIPAYSSAKAALSNFTQWLAVHFANSGIRVNAIAPGFFSTNQNKDLLYNKDGSETSRTKKIISHTPMNRFGKPSDLVGAVLFLTDDEKASFITGVIMPIDGGVSAYSGI